MSIIKNDMKRACHALWVLPALGLAACHGNDSPRLNPNIPDTRPVTIDGLVSDGPVIGGAVYGFDAYTIAEAMEDAAAAADRNAALDAAGPAGVLVRDDSDGDSYTFQVAAALEGEALFLVFDNTDAEDEDFLDTPPNLESIAIVGPPGSTQTINVSLHTTLIAQIVRAQLDPDGDGVPIDSGAISAALQAAEMDVLDAVGQDDDGDDLFDGESPIDTDDGELLHEGSSVLGLHIRSVAALGGLELDDVVEAMAADISDGSIDGLVGADFDTALETVAAQIEEFLGRDDDDEFAAFAVGPCSTSAVSLRRACSVDLIDDDLEGRAFCADISNDADRADCLADLADELVESAEECDDVFDARLEVCDSLDDLPHEPMFGPGFAADFIDPREIGNSITPNPYFPLVPGASWLYEGSFIDDEGDLVTETTTVTVTDAIKLIDGIPCLVVNDVVVSDAGEMENTDDWYAQDVDGNVWYCGEISRDSELFEGDDPQEFELVEIPGSWKHGRDGAKVGILMPAVPEVGDVLRQELLYGEAEDLIEVESVTGTESAPAGSCTGDCLVTLDFTPLEPDAEENKYYAPGIGMILEVNLETGDRVELMQFNPG